MTDLWGYKTGPPASAASHVHDYSTVRKVTPLDQTEVLLKSPLQLNLVKGSLIKLHPLFAKGLYR
jgi:hypothetical protein